MPSTSLADHTKSSGMINESINHKSVSMEANYELAKKNQSLNCRLARLTTAYQSVQAQNLQLRDCCNKLQNEVDNLQSQLQAIKKDLAYQSPPLRLVASHLLQMAAFLESIECEAQHQDLGSSNTVFTPLSPTSKSASASTSTLSLSSDCKSGVPRSIRKTSSLSLEKIDE